MNQDIIPIKRIDTNINIDEQQMELDFDQFMMPLRRKDIDIDINIEPQIIPDDVSLQLPDMTQELTEIQADHEFDIPEPTAISIVSDEKKIEPPIDTGLIQPPRTPSIPSIIGPDLPPIQPDTEPVWIYIYLYIYFVYIQYGHKHREYHVMLDQVQHHLKGKEIKVNVNQNLVVILVLNMKMMNI